MRRNFLQNFVPRLDTRLVSRPTDIDCGNRGKTVKDLIVKAQRHRDTILREKIVGIPRFPSHLWLSGT